MSEVVADGVQVNPHEELRKKVKPGMPGPVSAVPPPTDGVVEPLRGFMDDVRAELYGGQKKSGKKTSK